MLDQSQLKGTRIIGMAILCVHLKLSLQSLLMYLHGHKHTLIYTAGGDENCQKNCKFMEYNYFLAI